MNEEELRKAQQASRSAYLRREAVRRERAAAAVLEQRLNEVEQGILPTTVSEAQLLLKRTREVATAESLLATAQRRQALRGNDHENDGNEEKHRGVFFSDSNIDMEVAEDDTYINSSTTTTSTNTFAVNDWVANKSKCEVQDSMTTDQHKANKMNVHKMLTTPTSTVEVNETSNLREQQNSEIDNEHSSRTSVHDDNAFITLEKNVIAEKIAHGEFVLEKTPADIEAERVKMIQGTKERLRAQRMSLPIYQVRNDLLNTIRDNQVIVIVGETGSGKTTQLLQYLYEEGMHIAPTTTSTNATCSTHSDTISGKCDGSDNNTVNNNKVQSSSTLEKEELRLICTQPRRIAAISVAERVAQELGCRCGSIVGYKVRFDEKYSPLTRLVYMTDGIMLKEFTNDPNLDNVAAIMVDEAHERSINTDILLGLLRDLLRRNSRIKIIVASATINADKFSKFFNNAPIFTVHGRTFPVEVFYSDTAAADYITEAAQTVIGLHLSKPLPGDILVFLPGQDAIEACAESLRQYLVSAEHANLIRPLLILPIYASLAPKEQARIYDPTPPNVRKVVIATNIAETSITIDGVVFVVDCGLCKQDYYNARTMVEELRVVPISQASATQRAGRAGRTQRGECYRLYTPYTMKNELPSETIPEIKRCSMSAVVLQLKALGIDNLLQFDFIDMPSTVSLERALDHLYLLGAMKCNGTLTKTGRRMAEFPLEPSLSRCLIKGCALGCGRHMAMAAAMLTLESVFITSRDAQTRRQMESAKETLFNGGNGDVVGYVRILEEWLRCENVSRASEFCKTYCIHPRALLRARDVFDQILKIYDRVGLDAACASDEIISTTNNHDDNNNTSVNNNGRMYDDYSNATNSSVINCELLTRAILSGFFFNVARLELDKRTYRIIHPLDSTLFNSSDEQSRGNMLLSVANGTDGDASAPTAEVHPSSYLFKFGVKQNNAALHNSTAKPLLSTLVTSFSHGFTSTTSTESKLSSLSAHPHHTGTQLTTENSSSSSIPERPFLVVFIQLRHTTRRYMTHITAINTADWIIDSAPVNYFQREELENKLRKRTYY